METARQDIAPAPPHPVAPASEDSAIISMIERAARDPNVDIDKMERLLSMQERMNSQRARAAFAAAFADMQQELPVIAERGAIDHGNNRGVVARYALWEDINEAIKPVLARHGFGLRFAPGRNGERLTVTGYLSHREGHVEEATMELPADTSGAKNAVQAIGSSTSYGKRYIASALLNLTSRLSEDRDDDGAAGGARVITDEQASRIRALICETGADIGRFLAHIKAESIPDIPAAKFDEAVRALESKRSRR